MEKTAPQSRAVIGDMTAETSVESGACIFLVQSKTKELL